MPPRLPPPPAFASQSPHSKALTPASATPIHCNSHTTTRHPAFRSTCLYATKLCCPRKERRDQDARSSLSTASSPCPAGSFKSAHSPEIVIYRCDQTFSALKAASYCLHGSRSRSPLLLSPFVLTLSPRPPRHHSFVHSLRAARVQDLTEALLDLGRSKGPHHEGLGQQQRAARLCAGRGGGCWCCCSTRAEAMRLRRTSAAAAATCRSPVLPQCLGADGVGLV